MSINLNNKMTRATVCVIAAVIASMCGFVVGTLLLPTGARAEPGARDGTQPTGRITVADFAKEMPELQVSRAEAVVTNADVQVYRVPRSDGQECLIRIAGQGGAVNCVSSEKAARDGIIASLPGAAYGLLPPTVEAVQIHVKGQPDITQKLDGGYFEAPPEAIGGSFAFNGTQHEFGDLMPASELPDGVTVNR